MLKWTGGVAYTTPHEDEKEGWRMASRVVMSKYHRDAAQDIRYILYSSSAWGRSHRHPSCPGVGSSRRCQRPCVWSRCVWLRASTEAPEGRSCWDNRV